MAFQKQFKSSYVSYNGWEYYLEIWVNTTAGTITTSEIKLGTGGPVISYDTDNEDRFSPIISSNCVIPLVIESSVQENFVKQLREVYNERDVYVHLYKATEAQHSAVKPLWSGFVLMDLSSTPDEFYPYDFKITAVDGLGLLKDIDFVKPTTRRANEYLQTDMYYGPGRYTFWLKEILLKTGASTTTEGASEDYVFTTAINWYESQMPTITQSLDPFYITKCSVGMFHTKTDNGVFEVTNCYEVLKELLKHWGARMTYWKGQFWIVQIPQYITPDSGTYINPDNINTRTYDKTGSFISSSDNLGDSYYTRYQLNIGDLTGGIQKLTGTEVNYLPQIRETRANNVSFGNGNRYGGFPREFTGNSAPSEIIFQDQINDASDSDSFNLVIPLNVSVENGNPFFMKILFNFYCTDLTDTYYLQYNPTLTHKYYWVSSSQWTTLVNAPTWDSGFISPATGNSNQSQSHSNLEGFNQNILFKLYNTSTQSFSDLDLSGDFKFYLDIDAYGTNISNPGSFRFKLANAGLSSGQFFYPTHPSINVSWTNTLQSNYALQTPNIITNNAPNGNSIIQLTTPNIDPFEGMFVVITNTTGSIYGNAYVSSVNTSDVAIVDFGTLVWGDTLQISDLGCLQVYNGSTFVKSSSSGNWGNGILTGSLAFTQILLDEYLYGQTKVIESPSMRLVTSVLNRDSSDGSGLRPNYVNPIGRLKESRTNLSDVQYVFKRGAFYTLTDEWDYEGFEIRRDVSSIITRVKEITGPNNPVTGVGSVPKTTTVPNAFGQIISKQIITSTSSSVAAGAITSLPIALINDVVFKVGDFFNVLNSDTNEFIKFELNAQQFSDSSALTVVSQTITDNIPANSIITFNAFDLTSQYQNKTRGTVAGFDITATGIEKSSINITDWLNSDTMTGAAVTNVPTALSVKNYVDGQAGLTENLQTVTNNGNTTTNSVMIGSSNSPTSKLNVFNNNNFTNILDVSNMLNLKRQNANGNGQVNGIYIGVSGNNGNNNSWAGIIAEQPNSNSNNTNLIFTTRGQSDSIQERARITSGGKLLINTTTEHVTSAKVEVLEGDIFIGSDSAAGARGLFIKRNGAANAWSIFQGHFGTNNLEIREGSNTRMKFLAGGNVGIGLANNTNPTEKLHVVGDALITGDSHADAFKPAATGEPIKFKNFGSTEVGRLTDSGQFTLPSYGSGTFTGAETYFLAVTSGGDVVEADSSALPGGPYLPLTAGSSKQLTDALWLGGTTDATRKIFFTNSGSYAKGFFDAGAYGFQVVGSEKMTLTTTGLGIGTSSPAAKITIIGSGENGGILFNNAGSQEHRFYSYQNYQFNAIGSSDPVWNWVQFTGIGVTPTYKMTLNNTGLSITGGGVFTGDLLLGTTSAPVDLFLFGDTAGTSLTWSNSDDELQFSDNTKVTFGDSGDLQVYYDGVGGAIKSNGDLTFITNNSTKMTLTNVGGNLLLGTTSEDAKLNVNGNIRLNNELQLVNSAMKILRTVNDMHFNTNSATKMTLTSGGNLGLGVTSPSKKIEVSEGFILANGTGTSHGFELQRNSFDTFQIRHLDGNFTINNLTDSRKDFFINGSGNATFTGSLTGTTATFNDVFFGTTTYKGKLSWDTGKVLIGTSTANTDIVFIKNSNTELARITSGGNLLIGTTTDSGQKLLVDGTAKVEQYFYINDTGNSNLFFIRNESTFASIDNGTRTLNFVGGDKIFLNGSFAEAMRIKSNGNLLIGSTSDNGAKLQVTASATNNPIIEISNSDNGGVGPSLTINGTNTASSALIDLNRTNVGRTSAIRYLTNGTVDWHSGIFYNGGSSQSNYGIGTDRNISNQKIIIDTSGNIAINTTVTNSGAKLFVNGIIRTTGGSVQAGQDYGFTLEDEGNNNRYGLKFGAAGSVGGSNLLMLTNRSLSNATGGGEVAIGANASTTGVTETEVVRIKAVTQSEVSIDGILSLTVQDTPADPSNNKSSIWLDSNWDLKIKITNSSGDTVTKTIVEYA